MHYYKFNIADWVKDTAHLSLKEEAILLRLINYYVNTESFIPNKTQMVLRKLRIADESETVEILLEEFFIKSREGWRSKELDKIISEYQKRAERNRNNGKSGGRPKINDLQKPNGLPDANQMESEQEPSGNLNQELLTTNEELLTKEPEIKEPKKTSSRFAPPSTKEVLDYMTERGYPYPKEAESFIDYYSSNGWKVGKNPMKDWKAATRNWTKKLTKKQVATTYTPPEDYDPLSALRDM